MKLKDFIQALKMINFESWGKDQSTKNRFTRQKTNFDNLGTSYLENASDTFTIIFKMKNATCSEQFSSTTEERNDLLKNMVNGK